MKKKLGGRSKYSTSYGATKYYSTKRVQGVTIKTLTTSTRRVASHVGHLLSCVHTDYSLLAMPRACTVAVSHLGKSDQSWVRFELSHGYQANPARALPKKNQFSSEETVSMCVFNAIRPL